MQTTALRRDGIAVASIPICTPATHVHQPRPHSFRPHFAGGASSGRDGADEEESYQALPPRRVRLRAPGGPVPPVPPPALRPRPRGNSPAPACPCPRGAAAAGFRARELPRGLVLGGALAALLLSRRVPLLRPQPPRTGSCTFRVFVGLPQCVVASALTCHFSWPSSEMAVSTC